MRMMFFSRLLTRYRKEAGFNSGRGFYKNVGGRSAIMSGLNKFSIVGAGMRLHSGVASKMFTALAKEGINIYMVNTSDIKVSCFIEARYSELAVRILHEVFELGKLPA